jgi:hypothetical protein
MKRASQLCCTSKSGAAETMGMATRAQSDSKRYLCRARCKFTIQIYHPSVPGLQQCGSPGDCDRSSLPGVHFELAKHSHTSGDLHLKQKAEQEYDAALLGNPQDENVVCRLGAIAAEKGDTTDTNLLVCIRLLAGCSAGTAAAMAQSASA